GLLGDDVDRAADGAAAGDAARRTLVNFDLLDREALTRDVAGVADVVDEDVAAGVEAANEEVAIRGSALRRADGDAGRLAREVAEGGDLLVVEHLFRDGGNRPRRIDQRLGQLARARPLNLVGSVGVGVRVGALRRRSRAGLCGGRSRLRYRGLRRRSG